MDRDIWNNPSAEDIEQARRFAANVGPDEPNQAVRAEACWPGDPCNPAERPTQEEWGQWAAEQRFK